MEQENTNSPMIGNKAMNNESKPKKGSLPKIKNETVKDETAKEVVVDKGVLKGIMDELKTSRERLKVLEGLTGENTIKSWIEGHKDTTVKRVHLKVVEGQPVVSWSKLLKNSVREIGKGIWVEDLLMHIRLADGTTREIKHIEFTRNQDIKMFKIVGTMIDPVTYKATLTLEDELGLKLEVHQDFINP
jgi:hypothetical protein